MPLISPAFVTLNPNYMMPDLLLPYSQASGAFNALATGDALVRLGEGDLVAYIPRIDLRTKIAAGQMAYNELPSVSIDLSMISTATYLQRVRAEYDHHDTAAAGRWGVPIVQAYRLGMRQAHFNMARLAVLFGFNPVNGEGLLNANGATAVSLPADSNGNQTIATYDNGQLAFQFLTQISALKSRTNQLGIGREIVILGPQRTLSALEYQNIVQLTQFQRTGAGSTSTAGVIKDVLELNGDKLIWAYDDTLIGRGAGSTTAVPIDAVLIVMPEVENPQQTGFNTNEFARLAPGLDACTLQLCDMAAPREIPTPIAGGAIDILSELRITSGWAVRPEAVTIFSIQPQ